jgi:hypothetical protein
VLLAFAVVVVWEKFNQAESEVAKEAGAAATVFRLTQGVDPERGAAIREATTAYLRSAIESDWPAMESGTQSPATTEALNEIYRAILKFQSLGTDDEMFARCQEKCPHVALVPEVAAGDRLPEPVSALAEKARLLAAVPDHPLDEAQFVIHRWRGVPVVRDRDVGLGGKAGHRQGGGSSKHEAAPAEQRRRAKLDGGRMPPLAMRDLF